MADRRVVITGVGAVTAAGVGIAPLWDACVKGASAIKAITLFDPSGFPCRCGGQIDNFSASKFVPREYRKAVKVMARDIEIAVAAGDLAFRDSGIITRGIDPAAVTVDSKRLGCNIGAGLICSDLDELGAAVITAAVDGKFNQQAWGKQGIGNLTPLWLLKYLPNMLSCHVTIIHGAEGPSNTITCGDCSALLSVGEARAMIARDQADVAIAGGAESKLNPMGLLRQSLLKRLCAGGDDPSSSCRPFDAAACGTAIGEGGGLVILEEYERAKARGARIYAEVAGFAGACDPSGIDITKPNAGRLDLAVGNALRQAGAAPEQVGLIVTHGTGVPGEDACEAAAWHAALGGSAATVPATAFTGTTGTMFAGAGGVSLAVACKAIAEQTVPATAGFSAFAPGAKQLGLSSQARAGRIDFAVCGAFTIGGQSGACVLKKVQ